MTASSTDESTPVIRAELTALSRTQLSLPTRLALTDGLLVGRTILDYGCGRGDDVRRLSAAGLDARGWDPHYRPNPAPASAEVVLCNYVLNVIADQHERTATLQRAYSFAERVLVVAVRGTHESRHLDGRELADGTVTSRNTFHHLFSPSELRNWLQAVLDTPVVPVQPGTVYVFRNTADRAAYLSRRYGGEARPDTNGEVLARLVRFLEDHGRAPTVDEQPVLCEAANAAYGRLSRALGMARREVSAEALAYGKRARRLDLLVVLGLERFHGGPRLKDLPPDRIADVRACYPNLKVAAAEADKLLMATGQMENVRTAVRSSVVGKTSASALYVHVDAEHHLPALLRLYSACGAMVAGRPPETTLIKLHHDRPAVSFLEYPDFNRDPHPRIASSLTIDLAKLRDTWTDFSRQSNRPLLHRKEEFVHRDDPRFPKFERLTRSEERAGLYDRPDQIGREEGWTALLREKGLRLQGHRLLLSK